MKIAHVSLYPSQKGTKFVSQSGVASYSGYLYTAIQNKISKNDSQHVLANILENASRYQENKINIYRIWNRGWKFPVQILRKLLGGKYDVIHIQQEAALFGGYFSVPFFLLLLFILRIANKKVLVTIHGVPDLSLVDRKFVKENNSNVPAFFARFAMNLTFSSIALFSSKVIVHEEFFKQILLNHYHFTKENRIIAVQHGVVDLKKMPKKIARKKLAIGEDKIVFLFMGYLTGYKGLDQLILAFAELSKLYENVYLVVGAGIHPKLGDDKKYMENVYKKHKDLTKSKIDNDKYSWVGFIPDNEVGIYYSAADLVVFPYTVAMSSSGPMAISIGYETPFVASNVFAHFVADKSLLFERNVKSLKEKLEEFVLNSEKFIQSARNLKKDLLWDQIAPKYIEIYKDL